MRKTFKHDGKSCAVEVIEKAKIDIYVGDKPNPEWKADQPADSKEQPNIPVYEIQPRHLIVGYVDGKEVSSKILPLEDDIAHYAAQMEEELKAIVNKPRKKANPHLKTLKDKGYK